MSVLVGSHQFYTTFCFFAERFSVYIIVQKMTQVSLPRQSLIAFSQTFGDEKTMAKRKRTSDEKQNEKWKKEGRGQGRFENYKPWLKIQDVSSYGLATRIKGVKTGRCHQLLSNLELEYLYLLDWSEEVIDIREQYPLDLKETVALAKEIGLIHPPLSNPTKPIVMTTDFLVTIRKSIGTNEIARTVKYSKDLTNARVLEKFEIERLYWKERRVDWGIVTELDLDKTLIKNIKWFYKFRTKESLPKSINSEIIAEISGFMLPLVKQKIQPLRLITKNCDDKFALSSGNSLAFVRYLLATRKWQIDISKPIQPEKPLAFITENKGEKL